MTFSNEILPLRVILLHFLLYLMMLLEQVLKLSLKHFALIVLFCHEVGPLCELNL